MAFNEGIEGGINSIAIINERVWLATMQGCCYSAHSAGKSQFIKVPGIENQCANIQYHHATGRAILAAGNSGLYSILLPEGPSATGLPAETFAQAGKPDIEKIGNFNSYGLTISSKGTIFAGGRDGLYMVLPSRNSQTSEVLKTSVVLPGGRERWQIKQLLSAKEIREVGSLSSRPLPDDATKEEVWAGTLYEGLHS